MTKEKFVNYQIVMFNFFYYTFLMEGRYMIINNAVFICFHQDCPDQKVGQFEDTLLNNKYILIEFKLYPQ